jgi:hypothetical protein
MFLPHLILCQISLPCCLLAAGGSAGATVRKTVQLCEWVTSDLREGAAMSSPVSISIALAVLSRRELRLRAGVPSWNALALVCCGRTLLSRYGHSLCAYTGTLSRALTRLIIMLARP